jgi:soluble lytic murein transglycosylase-like protein
MAWAEWATVGLIRVVVLAAALGISAASLGGLARSVPLAPAVAAPGPAPAAAVRAARPGNWSVVVDGWYIELDDVAGLPAPTLDPERLEPPLLSPYDQLIVKYAEAAAIDWRLVAAIIYEESRFIADSVSEAGAYGLMQVMPIAAREMGEEQFREPEANIRTGVRYLQRLQREYAAARDRDRQALALAAYNMGIGHVQDAQALARRFGYDPLRWDGAMDVMISLLEEPQIYEQLRLGFAQGRSVVDYVDRVLRRYSSYRRDLPAVPPGKIAGYRALTDRP